MIHNHWLKHHGVNGRYDKTAVAPEDLGAFISALRGGERCGTNVTMPHKQAAIICIDEPDDRVRRIGALNTIWREGGKLHATSTDGPGFVASLKHTCQDFDASQGPIVMLGAGGSTRAIVDELLRMGATDIKIWNRTHSRAEALANHFGRHVKAIASPQLATALQSAQLLVNTTSAGITGEKALDLPWDALNPNAVVSDIVYTPLVTPFLHTAGKRGHVTVPGLGMLLHQAVFGFGKWFGVTPEVTPELHDLIARDIDPDFQP